MRKQIVWLGSCVIVRLTHKVKDLDEKKYNESHTKEYITQADEEDFICIFYKKSLKFSEMHRLIVQH